MLGWKHPAHSQHIYIVEVCQVLVWVGGGANELAACWIATTFPSWSPRVCKVWGRLRGCDCPEERSAHPRRNADRGNAA